MFGINLNRKYETTEDVIARMERYASSLELAAAGLRSAVLRIRNADSIEQFQDLAHDAVDCAELIGSSRLVAELCGWLNNIYESIQLGRFDCRLQVTMIAEIADELVK